MRKKVKEVSSLTDPITTIRIEPQILEQLKQITGKKNKATAIKEAIHERIKNDNSHELHVLHIDMRDVVTVQVAANLLKVDQSNVLRKIYNNKIRAIQPGGKKSTWYIYIDSIKALLVPNVKLNE